MPPTDLHRRIFWLLFLLSGGAVWASPGNPGCDNQLRNHEFNHGWESWEAYNNAAGNAMSLSIDNTGQLSGSNSVRLNISQATGTPWHLQFVHEELLLEAGKNYTVSFRARATGNRTLDAAVQQLHSPFDSYGYTSFNLTTTPQTYSFSFTAPSDQFQEVGLVFYVAASTTDIFLDDVSFSQTCGTTTCGGTTYGNVIRNFEFDHGLSNWGKGDQNGAASNHYLDNTGQLSGTNSLYVQPTTTTGVSWHSQFGNYARTLYAGTTYRVTFRAKATANRPLYVSLKNYYAPYEQYAGETVLLTTTDQTYSVDLTVPTTNDRRAGLFFEYGENGSAFWIDDIQMGEACGGEICNNDIDDDGDGLVDLNDPDCTECDAPTISLQNGTLVSGTALQTGSVYLFQNALLDTDVRVTVVNKSHGDVAIQSIDLSAYESGGYNLAFQPEVDYNWDNGDGTFDATGERFVTFKFDFYRAGTTTPQDVSNLTLSAVDVDGDDGSVMEFIETTGFTAYETNSPTNLTITGALKAKSTVDNATDIDETSLGHIISFDYGNQSSITVKYGADWNGAFAPAESRLNSLYFKCYELNTQVVCPEITVSGPLSVCNAESATLRLSATQKDGVCDMQWQSSINGTTWTDLANATGTSYDRPAGATATYYRAGIYCDGVGSCGRVYSEPHQITIVGNCSEVCDNGTDDDGDGDTDCADSDCLTKTAQQVLSETTVVTNPENALGYPDGQVAKLYEGTSLLTLDLGDTLAAGDTYTLHWKRRNYTTGTTAIVFIDESADAATWSTRPSISTSSNTVMEALTLTAAVDTRYLRFYQENGSQDDFEVDAVVANIPCSSEICGNGTDDDGDGLVDGEDPDCCANPLSYTTQAENATLNGGVVSATNQGNYQGSGFADYPTGTGYGVNITWTETVPAAGKYQLAVRYALGSGTRPLNLYVNGTQVATLNLTTTGDWASWRNYAQLVTLNGGTNTLVLAADASSQGPNIDQMTLSGCADEICGNGIDDDGDADVDCADADCSGPTVYFTKDCAQDAIAANPNGGVAPYTITWDDLPETAHYTFENSTDDRSGNGNHQNPTGSLGTPTYSTDAVQGRYSLAFDGSTYLRYSQDGGFMEVALTQLSVAFWVRPGTLNGRQTLLDEGGSSNGFSVYLDGNQLRFSVRDGSTQVDAPALAFPADGAWHHVAAVYDQGTITLYLDGVGGASVATGFVNNELSAHGGDGGLGYLDGGSGEGGGTGQFYTGLMDDFRYLLGVGLTADQVADMARNDGVRTNVSPGDYTVRMASAHSSCATVETYNYSGLCNEICGNGIDDDNDGFTDQFDADCNLCSDYATEATIFRADFENTLNDNNWTLGGGATDGNFVIGTPSPYQTTINNTTQMELSAQGGTQTLLTGAVNNQDLDGGPTTARSPDICLPETGCFDLDFYYYFADAENGGPEDYFRIELRDATDHSVLQTLVAETGDTLVNSAVWTPVQTSLNPYAGSGVYLYVEASDPGTGGKVEAALDEVTITANPACGGNCELGFLALERFNNLPGTDLSTLTGAANYPYAPDEVVYLTSMAYNPTHSPVDNYGIRIRGYLQAPETGDYRFTVTGDDNVVFYLGTSSAEASKVLRGSIPGWTNETEFTKYPEQESGVVSLVAGERYYLEYLGKEGSGGDHFYLYWRTPSNATRSVVPGSVLYPYDCIEQCPTYTLTSRVSGSADDAEEYLTDGAVDLGSTDLELGVENAPQLVGLRFRDLYIPQGAIVTNAYLEFETDEISTGAANLTVRGQNSNSASMFGSSSGNLTNRPKTTTAVAWNAVPDWNVVDEQHVSPNLKDIIQEIVDRPGWETGNDLALFLEGTGERTAESYDGEPGAAPQLRVEFQSCDAVVNAEVTCDEGQTVELLWTGLQNDVPETINIPNPGNVTRTIVEVVYHNAHAGTTVDLVTNNGTFTESYVSLNDNFIYRWDLAGSTSYVTYADADNQYAAQSINLYVFRDDGSSTLGVVEFSQHNGYDELFTFDIPIPLGAAPRDVQVQLPLSEVTLDGRCIYIEAEAGGVSQSDTRCYTSLPRGCCLDLYDFTLPDVPAGADHVTITIDSRVSTFPGSGAQSYVIAGTVLVNVACSCPDFSVGIDATPGAGCVGSPIVFSSPDLPELQDETYTWDFGAGASPATATGPGPHSVVYATSGTKTAVLRVRNAICDGAESVQVVVIDNATSGGSIGSDESVCGSYDPANIISLSAPNGTGGTLEYEWQGRTDPENDGTYGAWGVVAGATGPSYDPPTIGVTTQYRRRARRSPCTDWVVSNVVTKARAAAGTDLVVNTTNDTNDANPGDGTCADSNCECSLRAAIEEANAQAGANTITFDIPPSDGRYTDPDGTTGNGDEYFNLELTLGDLPTVTEALTVDALTQPNAACSGAPFLPLDGSLGGEKPRDLLILVNAGLLPGQTVNWTSTAGAVLLRGLVMINYTAAQAGDAVGIVPQNGGTNVELECSIICTSN